MTGGHDRGLDEPLPLPVVPGLQRTGDRPSVGPVDLRVPCQIQAGAAVVRRGGVVVAPRSRRTRMTLSPDGAPSFSRHHDAISRIPAEMSAIAARVRKMASGTVGFYVSGGGGGFGYQSTTESAISCRPPTIAMWPGGRPSVPPSP